MITIQDVMVMVIVIIFDILAAAAVRPALLVIMMRQVLYLIFLISYAFIAIHAYAVEPFCIMVKFGPRFLDVNRWAATLDMWIYLDIILYISKVQSL